MLTNPYFVSGYVMQEMRLERQWLLLILHILGRPIKNRQRLIFLSNYVNTNIVFSYSVNATLTKLWTLSNLDVYVL